jgi:predicted dehydrogenase
MTTANSGEKPIRIELPQRALNRRQFIYTTALTASSLALSASAATPAKLKSPNEKLDFGVIGAAGRGGDDANGVSGENIVAVCDIDANNLAGAAKRWPKARLYRDYRVMLEKEKGLDAVTIGIPDHHHAPAAMLAIKSRKHVYCEKPLTHTISEARALTLAAREYKVMTQMGNQGHCGTGNRELCEMIWAGAIGPVREVHCWSDRPIWPQGLPRPQGSDPVPPNIDWDLWIGPAPMRPYLSKWPDGRVVYLPTNWRAWWDFGCGALGDMGCHIMDGANWALKLGPPATVEIVDSSPLCAETPPSWCILRYHFPARGDMPPCTLTWYDGGKQPPKPPEMEGDKFDGNSSLFIGDKGKILSGCYGERPRLLPESSMADYKRPPQIIPRVPGDSPHQDFIRACKGGPAPCSNFDVSGPFTETVLLGNLVLRVGKTIEWDSKKMRVKNMPGANQFIHGHYRKGWKV